LVVGTVKAAALLAAGQAAALTTPAALLMNKVVQTMMLTKVKLAVAAVMVTAALGASGLAYRASGEDAPPAGKPRNEVEALRRENELLKLNLEVVLEKVRALDTEVRTLRGRLEAKAARPGVGAVFEDVNADGWVDLFVTDNRGHFWEKARKPDLDPVQEVEAALKAFREARDKEAKRRAADALEKALKKLREQTK
jgi:hypothetical protein